MRHQPDSLATTPNTRRHTVRRAGHGLATVLALAAFAVPATASAGSHASAAATAGARGAFTCDFGLPGDFPLDQVVPAIERDRIYMARRPGMVNKHLPILQDAATGTLRSGGRYLFDTYRHARDYLRFVSQDYVLDGVQFLARPYFLNPDCHAWKTIGAKDFADIHNSRAVMRTERWSVPAGNVGPQLAAAWPHVRAAAAARGLTSAWLLYSPSEKLVSLVYYDNHTAALAAGALDVPALAGLAASSPLGAKLARPAWTKLMDVTEFVLTIWFPNPSSHGDTGERSLWPNSPPLPFPSASDGVCEPSRGENGTTAPADCSPKCGNGLWNRDEDNHRCPSDVPAWVGSIRALRTGEH